METKTIETTLVAKHRLTTTLAEVMSGKLEQPKKLMEEVAKQGYDVYVPHVWNYIACDGEMESKFTLEMCIPVDKKGEEIDFVKFAELPAVKCVSHTFKGPYSEIGPTYEKIFSDIGKKGIIPSGNCREVYHHWDMQNPENNITEILVEIK